jgi:four helix bundle protein
MKNGKDILDRTFRFGARIIKMGSALPKTPAGFALASQVIRSGTSIGANIQEAQSAMSKKDFIHCVQISLKEARETKFWIELITESNLLSFSKTKELVDENDQLIRILTIIIKHAKINSN